MVCTETVSEQEPQNLINNKKGRGETHKKTEEVSFHAPRAHTLRFVHDIAFGCGRGVFGHT